MNEVDEIAWERWLLYRKAIKKPIKPISVEAARKRLAKFGADQAEVVEQSIANGWQGLFELKTHGTNNGNGRARVSAVQRSQQKLREWAIERGIDPETL